MNARPGCVADIAASLDGFIATADGSVAWLEAFQATDDGYAEFAAGIGTLVMGRATYDQVLAFGAWPYAGKACLVLSRRGIANAPDGVAAWKGDAASLAAHLAKLPDRVWVVEAGMVRAQAELRLAGQRHAVANEQEGIALRAFRAGETGTVDLFRVRQLRLEAANDEGQASIAANRARSRVNQAVGVLP